MPGRKAPEAARREQILTAAFRVACRKRLEGLTIRAIAEEAEMSGGLVLFHFGSRDEVLVGLLVWLLRTTIVGDPTPEVLALPTAEARLLGLLRQELELLPERRQRLELFFDYWVAGIANPRIRRRVRRALQRYRGVIVPLAADVIAEAPERFCDVDAEALAAVVAAVIEGCVVQAIIEPRTFDIERVLTTVAALVARAA